MWDVRERVIKVFWSEQVQKKKREGHLESEYNIMNSFLHILRGCSFHR